MKVLLALALLVTSLLAVPARATEVKPDVAAELAKATLLVYQGKQVCRYHTEIDFIFEEQVWGCEFVTHFTCTATVVDKDGEGGYVALTAGHCFDYDAVARGEYYVADTLVDKPVVHKIAVQKFANDDRYDYAVITFRSLEDYPVIPISMDVNPKIGDQISNVNYAFGLVKQVTRGPIVSGLIDAPAVPDLKDTKGRFLVAIGLGPGASGSAVINDKGEIIGIVEAVFPRTQMPTVVMPTGKTFKNFIQDDSAGLKPEPPGPLPREPRAPRAPEPTAKELVAQLLAHRNIRKLLIGTGVILFSVGLVLALRKLIVGSAE
jgi:Trypsin-like peptidase domain